MTKQLHQRRRQTGQQIENDVESFSTSISPNNINKQSYDDSDHKYGNNNAVLFNKKKHLGRISVIASGSALAKILCLGLVVMLLTFCCSILVANHTSCQFIRPTERQLDNLPVQIASLSKYDSVPSFNIPKPQADPNAYDPSYNHLEFYTLKDEPIFSRRINYDDENLAEKYRHDLLKAIDKKHFSANYEPDEDLLDVNYVCVRNNWRTRRYPNCNMIHEMTIERPFGSDVTQDFQVKYMGHGHFRDAWLLNSTTTDFIFKRLRLNDEFDVDYYDMHKIHREAIIMERLTASPRIVDIYGFCSTTLLSETMASEVWRDMVPGTGHAKQAELDLLDDVYPKNKYTVTEKLEMSLVMAEALADIHGFEGGVILHGDTHPEQWLRAKNGILKLNDFNNAEILDWDRQQNQYCRSWRQYGGFYRAPEEYIGTIIDEGIDTFAFGNNIYCLLTGLWPFYEWSNYEFIQRKLLKGERAYIDPRYRTRSWVEGKLIEIMELTWEHDIDKRISIFEVVKFLRATLKEHRRREGLPTA